MQYHNFKWYYDIYNDVIDITPYCMQFVENVYTVIIQNNTKHDIKYKLYDLSVKSRIIYV